MTNLTSSIQVSEEALLVELGLLYNHKADDSAQFTRWQMLVAIRHGMNLAMKAAEPLPQGDEVEAAKWRIWERALELELPLVQADAEELARAALVRSKLPEENDAQFERECFEHAAERIRQSRQAKAIGDDVRERVARAIAPRLFYEFDCQTMDRAARWDLQSDNDKETLRLMADDAITAIGSQSDEADDPHWEQKAIAKLGSQSIEGERVSNASPENRLSTGGKK